MACIFNVGPIPGSVSSPQLFLPWIWEDTGSQTHIPSPLLTSVLACTISPHFPENVEPLKFQEFDVEWNKDAFLPCKIQTIKAYSQQLLVTSRWTPIRMKSQIHNTMMTNSDIFGDMCPPVNLYLSSISGNQNTV